MTRSLPSQVMEDCIVRRTDATPESRVLREAAPGVRKPLGMIEETVRANHLIAVLGRAVAVTTQTPQSSTLLPMIFFHGSAVRSSISASGYSLSSKSSSRSITTENTKINRSLLPYRVIHSRSYTGDPGGKSRTNSDLTSSAASLAAWNSAALRSSCAALDYRVAHGRSVPNQAAHSKVARRRSALSFVTQVQDHDPAGAHDPQVRSTTAVTEPDAAHPPPFRPAGRHLR